MARQFSLALLVCVVPAFALAKLPAPTAQEQAAAQQNKAQEATQEAQQKKALDAAQDQVVQNYKNNGHGSPSQSSASSAASTDPATMPRKAVETPGEAGPHGGRTPSAEAHSSPVR